MKLKRFVELAAFLEGSSNIQHPMRFFVTAFLMLLLAPAAQGQGIIVGPDFQPAPLRLTDHAVEADIHEQVAVVTVQHTFHNPSNATYEGTFLFPLPPHASVSRFSMNVNGTELQGEVMEEDEARKIYEDIVRRSLDPALLEMADYQTFRARLFPIPPGESRTLTLRYDATLDREDATVSFVYPMKGTLSNRWVGRPIPMPRPTMPPQRQPDSNTAPEKLQESTITINIASEAGLKNIYSPSHTINKKQPTDHRATVSLGANNGLDGRDFVLYYSLDSRQVGASFLAHRPYEDKAGYFMVLLSPEIEIPQDRIQPRDVVFVLDTSGSMAGDKIEQAREALKYCLNRLGERDRYGIVAFSSDVDAFRDDLLPANRRDDGLYFVDQLEARGGTNINDALTQAMGMLENSDEGMIVFLTDGKPSSGVTNESEIRKNIAKANKQEIALFTFGVGYDVNTMLLDGLSQEAGAFADYISPEENIEEHVGTFYDKVRYPVMTDLAFTFDGAGAYAFSPSTLPNLYKNGQLIIAGRYRNPAAATLTVTGTLFGEPQTLSYDLAFPQKEQEQDFVARIWATRRVGHLLDEIRRNGQNDELKEEVIALAKEFGLVTPYTSYLVLEEEFDVADQMQSMDEVVITGATRPRRRLFNRSRNEAAMSMDASSGQAAVQASKSIRSMKEVAVEDQSNVQIIQGRTMLNLDAQRWRDIELEDDFTADLTIQVASDAFFRLLALYPDTRDFGLLGTEVTFIFKEKIIHIGPEGEDYTEASLKQLLGR